MIQEGKMGHYFQVFQREIEDRNQTSLGKWFPYLQQVRQERFHSFRLFPYPLGKIVYDGASPPRWTWVWDLRPSPFRYLSSQTFLTDVSREYNRFRLLNIYPLLILLISWSITRWSSPSETPSLKNIRCFGKRLTCACKFGFLLTISDLYLLK